jgi:hypothetical protein
MSINTSKPFLYVDARDEQGGVFEPTKLYNQVYFILATPEPTQVGCLTMPHTPSLGTGKRSSLFFRSSSK